MKTQFPTSILAALLGVVFAASARAQRCLEIQCPEDILVECAGPAGAVAEFDVFATNHCSTNLTLVCSPASGSMFPPGDTTVVCTATDTAGNSINCNFTVTVRDTSPPELLCPDLIQVPCEGPDGAQVFFDIDAQDLCDTNVNVTCNPPSGTVFPAGTNTVLCVATDDAGNVERCVFPVVVSGDCASDPCVSIVCLPDMTVPCNTPGGAYVEFAVQATNLCSTNLVVTCDPPSGSLFPVGMTTVLCTAEGGPGNSTYCSFVVEVLDTNAPTLSCPGNFEVPAGGLDGAIVDWSVVAEDDCDTNVTVQCEPPSGSLFPIGTSMVRCTATDHSGNQALCGFLVTVQEPGPLTITLQSPTEAVLHWFVPGTVEVAGVLLPSGDWKPAPGPVVTNGNERTLVYSLDEDRHYFRLAATPLASPPDEDGDGVPDALDQCPGTPSGVAVNEHGCSLIALATHPERVAGKPMHRLSGLLDHFGEFLVLTETVAQVETELTEMNVALGMIRAGQITAAGAPLGVERFGAAVDRTWSAYSNMLAIIETGRRELIANPPDTQGYGDVTPEDAELMSMELLAHNLLKYLQQIQQADDSLQGVAQSFLGQENLRGTITSINDAERWLQLDNGQRVGLPEKQFEGLLAVGTVVDLTAQHFDDGSMLAETAAVVDSSTAFPNYVPAVECLHLRVAPAQKFPPYSSGPYVMHYPSAYQHEGKLWLESGMRFAVEDGGCGTVLGEEGKTYIRYRMKLELHYTPLDSVSTKAMTLATSLGPESVPVPLPGDIDPIFTAMLNVTLFRQECSLLVPDACSEPEVVSEKVYFMRVLPRYSYASVSYRDTVFDLEDSPQETSFRSTRTWTLLPKNVLSGEPGLHFLAQGYTVSGSQSSYPNLGFLTDDALPFAVYESDLIDSAYAPEASLGTTNRSALYWPRVTGYHNGRPFWYSCELPAITRDAVALCTIAPPTLYRLPFSGGWPTWTISQGNFGSFTHKGWQAYAYDFPAPQFTQVRAARGGIVEEVTENFTVSNWNPILKQCTAFNENHVVIRHQDGTTGNYLHMPYHGVLVSEGQKIRRGDIIAVVGTTGCSTGPHLHFDVRNAAGSQTLPSRFEAWSVCLNPFPEACGPLQECTVPAKDQILFSNNKAWSE